MTTNTVSYGSMIWTKFDTIETVWVTLRRFDSKLKKGKEKLYISCQNGRKYISKNSQKIPKIVNSLFTTCYFARNKSQYIIKSQKS